jgi:hypothetical protein
VAPLSHAAAAAFGEKALHKKDTCIGLVSGPDVSHWSVFLVGSRAWRVVVVFSPLPTLLFFLSNRPTHTHTTPTHFARRLWRHHCDQCAQWRLPPPLHFYLTLTFFLFVLSFFPSYEKTPKKTKWPIFIILVFTMGNLENRDLYHWLNIGDVYLRWPTRPTTKNGTRKMAARSHTHVRVCAVTRNRSGGQLFPTRMHTFGNLSLRCA